jgi:hypothetical protein
VRWWNRIYDKWLKCRIKFWWDAITIFRLNIHFSSLLWWWRRLDDEKRFDDENDLMMKTIWWWKRFDDENDLMMKTIYLSTLNWADKELFFIFLYIVSLEQTWQNSSNINFRVELKALINSIRSNINSRVEFELLFEIQFYDQIRYEHTFSNISTSLFEYKHIFFRIQAHLLSRKKIQQRQACCTRSELIV